MKIVGYLDVENGRNNNEDFNVFLQNLYVD